MSDERLVALGNPWNAVKDIIATGDVGFAVRLYDAELVDQARALAALQSQQALAFVEESNRRLTVQLDAWMENADVANADLARLRQELDDVRDEGVKAWDVENELRHDAEDALVTAQARLQQLETAMQEKAAEWKARAVKIRDSGRGTVLHNMLMNRALTLEESANELAALATTQAP